MQNLSQLKLNANRYLWKMLHNSWCQGELPAHLIEFRPVARVQTQKLAFTTVKNGLATESWTNFPKAKNLEIKALENGDYYVTFKGETEKHCTLEYLLKPIEA